MLKIIYTETGLYLEKLSESLESWVTNHVILSLRAGIALCTEPTKACLTLKGTDKEYEAFMGILDVETSKLLALSFADPEYLEIGFEGIWLDLGHKIDEGTFVTSISEPVEQYIYEWWQNTYNLTKIPD